jgi:hypothetical protein
MLPRRDRRDERIFRVQKISDLFQTRRFALMLRRELRDAASYLNILKLATGRGRY